MVKKVTNKITMPSALRIFRWTLYFPLNSLSLRKFLAVNGKKVTMRMGTELHSKVCTTTTSINPTRADAGTWTKAGEATNTIKNVEMEQTTPDHLYLPLAE